MFSADALAVLALGFYLGAKHALDADHLIAISTFVGERRTMLGSLVLGGMWGLGHTATLFVIGAVMIIFNLKLPERIALGLEFLVALMLIVLGLNALRRIRGANEIHWHPHSHGSHVHAHPHIHSTSGSSHHHFDGAWKPLFVGMVHGLAGSAALMLIVLSTIQSRTLALAYILVFGIGSIGGMALLSSLISLPLRVTLTHFDGAQRLIRTVAGIVSVGFGVFLALQVGRDLGRIGF